MWNASSDRDTSAISSEDISLENLLSPFSYGQETPLPAFQSGSNIHAQNSRGFISQDSQWGCCYSRNSIKCFPVDSYATSGQYCSKGHVPVTISTTSFHFQSASITCATEIAIHNHKTVSGIRKILLGLKVKENESLIGALVIFDPIRSMPMKWITLPSPVSSVSVLSHYEEGGCARPFFNEAMLTMVGVAAVGMEGCQVVIVDLGLDDPNLSSWDNALAPGIHKYHVMPVEPHELLIAVKRHNLVTMNNLICVDLTSEHEEDSEEENDYYYYCSPEKTVLCALEKDSISVTCLEYIPAIGSLIVGYSFGCFQIWGVDSATLLYSSPVPAAEVANEIFGFAFLQPEDDPRNICYLWVLFGKQTLEMHYSHAELYGLLYNKKPYSENVGFSYEEFRQCIKRLTVRLEDYFDSASENEDSMDEGHYPLQRYSVRPVRMWSQTDHLTFFSWESNRNGVYYVGIFDLNQWYSNHTSEKIRYSSVGLCPYWVAIPVETIDRFATVWDVGVVPKSIEIWENPHSKLDIHLYPASITFRGVCLSSTGTSTFEFFGIQEKLLRILQKNGPDLMVDPGRFKNLCQMYGLQPVMSHRYDDLESQQDADRFFILSILLESRRSSFIMEMANKWIDGSYVNVGCSVDLILNWVSSFTCAIRSVADQHWENLLTFRNEILPPETAHFINYSNFIWHALLGVLNMLMRPNEVYESHTNDLEDLKFALEKFVQYSASLLMFYKAGILPEVNEHKFVAMMLKYYDQKRADVKQALQSCDFLEPEIKSSHPLLIDYLLENFDEKMLREQWNLEPNECLYPPKHIGYILNMFMWAHEYPKAISRIIAYYLIDFSSIINETVKLRGDFASIIQLSTEEQTEIYNLWALDHGSCHEVLLFLSQKDRLHESDGLPWCAAVVILTALGHGESIIELLQKSCPTKLGRLYFNLMTTSRIKYNFLIDDICSTPALMESTHLQNFFEVSDRHNLLGEFVKSKSCSAPATVTDALVEYLKSHNNFENCDRLLSYYVHKEDWAKLREVYSGIRIKSLSWKLSNHQKSVWQIRQKLVESLLKPIRQSFQKFVSGGSPQIVAVSGPSRKIKVHHVKRPYTLPTLLMKLQPNNNLPNEIKLPPQLRNMKLLEATSSCALSPMKTPGGSRHAVMGSIDEDNNGTPKSVRDLSRAPISILSSSPDTPNSSFGQRKSYFRSTSRISFSGSSPINLIALLKTPAVDHRFCRRSQGNVANVTIEMNESIYGTPSGGDRLSTSSVQSVHSIMKKQDSLRKFVCRKGLRFSDFAIGTTGDSDNDEESERSSDMPMGIKTLERSAVVEESVVAPPNITKLFFDETNMTKVLFDETNISKPLSEDANKPLEMETSEDESVDSPDREPQPPNQSDTRLFEETRNPVEIEILTPDEPESEENNPRAPSNMSEVLFDETNMSNYLKAIPPNNKSVLEIRDRPAERESSEDRKLNSEATVETICDVVELVEHATENIKPLELETIAEEEWDPEIQEQQDRSGNSVEIEITSQSGNSGLNEALMESNSDRSAANNEDEIPGQTEDLMEPGNTNDIVELVPFSNHDKNSEECHRQTSNENELRKSDHECDIVEIQLLNEEEDFAEPESQHPSISTEETLLEHEYNISQAETVYTDDSSFSSPEHQTLNKAVLQQHDSDIDEIHAQEGYDELQQQQQQAMNEIQLLENGGADVEIEITSNSALSGTNLNEALMESNCDTDNTANITNEVSGTLYEQDQEDRKPGHPNMSEALFDDYSHYREDVTMGRSGQNGRSRGNDTMMEDDEISDISTGQANSEKSGAFSPPPLGLMTRSQSRRSCTPETEGLMTRSQSRRSYTPETEGLMTRNQSRRRSCTPESERSFRSTSETSERRVTRSQARKESEFDVSVSGSEESFTIFEATTDDSPKSSRKGGRATRSGRSRSKTPSRLLPIVQEDEELKIEPPMEVTAAKEKTKKRREKKIKEDKTPVKEEKISPATTSATKDIGSKSTRKRKVVEPHPEPEPPVVEEIEEVKKVKKKTSKRKSMKQEEQKTPVKEEHSSGDDGSVSKPAKKPKRRQLQIYDYAPGLSTIIEDSDHSITVMQESKLPSPPPKLSPPKARGKRTPNKALPSKGTVAETVVQLGRRRHDTDSDDDSKSDISATSSSRSLRSTSTPELSLIVDPDQSFSFLSATVIEPKVPSPRKTRGRSKEPKQATPSPAKSIEEIERAKPVKRRKKSADDDDDAKSDISVASSRSTRSNASRRSTDRTLMPKRTTRSSKK